MIAEKYMSDYFEANRAAWNEAAPRHAEAAFQRLLESFQQPGFSVLDAIETGHLQEIGITGKDVVQLSCNNGRELLSIKNMGAGRCVGFDISDGFIEQAQKLVATSGIACEFLRTNVYEIPGEYNNSFDLVYITVGALGWLPDLNSFFSIVARLLRPNGWLLIYEMHPILDMFEQGTPGTLDLVHSYFRTEPYVEDDGLDYVGNTEYKGPVSYWFHHKMSDIIQSCIDHGLDIRRFTEYDHDISNAFANLAQEPVRPPLTYVLAAHKSAT
jgi:ubiquinone/menaquinone biosynthesis C-methylase UbiE